MDWFLYKKDLCHERIMPVFHGCFNLNGFLYYVILLSKATKTYDWEV